jgi:lipopolysaccharide/colanic/teichoic acid biosynthesis glycosyltransferase
MLVCVIAVKLSSPGPAIYGGTRVGRNKKEFRIYKLRTMRQGADKMGPAITAGDDPRITPTGRVLRRLKLDELPQLLNVLRGDMSLVGPRPEAPKYVAHYTPDQLRLLSVRPGITGPAALAYINEEEILRGGDAESAYLSRVMPMKLAIDLRYVDTATFAGDLRILAQTFLALFRRRTTPA